jgi:hypothetical protein
MKPFLEMAISEIEAFITVHSPTDSEKLKAGYHVSELRKIVEFMEYRIKYHAIENHTCDQCEEIKNRKPKREKKNNDISVNFSLD